MSTNPRSATDTSSPSTAPPRPSFSTRVFLTLGLSGYLAPIVVLVGLCVVQIRHDESPFDPMWAEFNDGPWKYAILELALFWLIQPVGLFFLAVVSGTVAPHSWKGCGVLLGLCLLSVATLCFIVLMCV